MIEALIAVIVGLVVLVWSAGLFVEGSAVTARYAGMPPLLIGMVVVGFGTSAPEMIVSAVAALDGNPGLALGNAYGSNITNIALILGVTALIAPIAVHSRVLRVELPVLSLVTLLAAIQLWDGQLTRTEGFVLLAVFAGLLGWSIHQGLRQRGDTLGLEIETELQTRTLSLWAALSRVAAGLTLLIISSRVLVWGATKIAREFGVDDLIIGLTIVALGTSLPELASSIVAARRKEHDIALGNILGSNLFNTLAVVGIAGTIHPLSVSTQILHRDLPVMALLTLSLFVFGFGFRAPGRINRIAGSCLLVVYLAYTGWLVSTVF